VACFENSPNYLWNSKKNIKKIQNVDLEYNPNVCSHEVLREIWNKRVRHRYLTNNEDRSSRKSIIMF